MVFLIAPIYAWVIDFAELGTAALLFLKGGLVWLSLGIGIAFLLIGIIGLKD